MARAVERAVKAVCGPFQAFIQDGYIKDTFGQYSFHILEIIDAYDRDVHDGVELAVQVAVSAHFVHVAELRIQLLLRIDPVLVGVVVFHEEVEVDALLQFHLYFGGCLAFEVDDPLPGAGDGAVGGDPDGFLQGAVVELAGRAGDGKH